MEWHSKSNLLGSNLSICGSLGTRDHLRFVATAGDRCSYLLAVSIIFWWRGEAAPPKKTGSLSNRRFLMLITEKSLKSRFSAIFTSVLLIAPPNYADRLQALTSSVINDTLSNLELIFPIDITIVAIVIGAYWHQDLQEVRSRILELQSHSNADIQELVLAYAIALACRGELKPQSFIAQICHDFNKRRSLSRNLKSQQKCLDQLHLTQELVNQGASAITAHRANRLAEAISSSLYYFLSTPHSWYLITERAQRHPQSNNPNNVQITLQCGAIASAYLGKIGNTSNQNQEILTKGEIIGEQLWAEWSGVFDVKLDN